MGYFLIELPEGRTPDQCTTESGNGCEVCGMTCGITGYRKLFRVKDKDVVNNGVIEEEAYYTDADDVR